MCLLNHYYLSQKFELIMIEIGCVPLWWAGSCEPVVVVGSLSRLYAFVVGLPWMVLGCFWETVETILLVHLLNLFIRMLQISYLNFCCWWVMRLGFIHHSYCFWVIKRLLKIPHIYVLIYNLWIFARNPLTCPDLQLMVNAWWKFHHLTLFHHMIAADQFLIIGLLITPKVLAEIPSFDIFITWTR